MTAASGTNPPAGDGDRFPRSRFAPWVGPNYDDGAVDGLRLLILGESHYGFGLPESQERGLTSLVVTDHLSHKRRHGFVRGVSSAVLGEKGRDERAVDSLWNSAAFYNYVQEYAGDGPRKRPRREAWGESAPAFCDVLAELRPDLMIVCGRTLWVRMKEIEGLSSDGVADDARTWSRIYHSGGARTLGGMIYHPASFGFRPSEWHPRVRRYIERAHAVKAGRLDA